MRTTPLIVAGLAAALATSVAWADAPPAAPNAGAATAPPAAPADLTTTDIRCIVVAGALAQNDDPDLKKLGGVSFFYFLGRLEGRGATGNLDARVSDAATKMTADDFGVQVKTCSAMIGAAGQSLQDLGAAVQARIGGAAPAK